jgi:hypothetical protein
VKDAHLHFRIGNVIKTPDPGGTLEIVTSIDDRVIRTVAAWASNVSSTALLDDQERTCPCGDELYNFEDDCERCHGTGRYTEKILGWSRSTIIAQSVKDWIINTRKAEFGF